MHSKTKFKNSKEEFEVIDFMPRFQDEKGYYHAPPEIIRLIKPIKGTPNVKFLYEPKLEYAQGTTSYENKKDHVVSYVDYPVHDSLFLYIIGLITIWLIKNFNHL